MAGGERVRRGGQILPPCFGWDQVVVGVVRRIEKSELFWIRTILIHDPKLTLQRPIWSSRFGYLIPLRGNPDNPPVWESGGVLFPNCRIALGYPLCFVRAEVVSIDVHPHAIAMMRVQKATRILEWVGFIKSIPVWAPIANIFELRRSIHDS